MGPRPPCALTGERGHYDSPRAAQTLFARAEKFGARRDAAQQFWDKRPDLGICSAPCGGPAADVAHAEYIRLCARLNDPGSQPEPSRALSCRRVQ